MNGPTGFVQCHALPKNPIKLNGQSPLSGRASTSSFCTEWPHRGSRSFEVRIVSSSLQGVTKIVLMGRTRSGGWHVSIFRRQTHAEEYISIHPGTFGSCLRRHPHSELVPFYGSSASVDLWSDLTTHVTAFAPFVALWLVCGRPTVRFRPTTPSGRQAPMTPTP